MFLHKYFKVNGEEKGIPPFMMYCNSNQKETTYIDSRTYKRFDWIKVVGRNKGIYVQLCCLIELISIDAQLLKTSNLIYIGIETIGLPHNPKSACRSVFPQIKYKTNRFLQVYCVCDSVDSILEPVY